jgi:hypothetical protein
MNRLSRTALLLAVLTPLSATAAIDIDDPGDEPGGGGGGGGTGDPPPPQPTWTKSYTKSDLWGSSDWGAGYRIYGNMSATPAHDTVKDKLTASLGLETYAKINGSHTQLATVRAAGSTEAKKATSLSFNAYVGSANVYTKSYTSTTSTYTFLNVTPVDWEKTFFNKSVNISVGIIPVSFTVKSTGRIKFNLTGKISNVGVEAAATPGGKASLYASAAIGGQYCLGPVCVGATAGVYADVNLLEASAPANAALWWSLAPITAGVLLNYSAKADATIKSLDGELGLFAEGCIGGCIYESVELIDWDGFAAAFNIANYSGSHCLVGQCSLVMNPGLPTSPGKI